MCLRSAYHAIGSQVNFIAITKPPTTAVALFDYDLISPCNGISCFAHVVRLWGVLG
jgi:hypothetical protein